MKFLKLNTNKHDLNKVAELIYETDSKTFNFYFKSRKGAAKRIRKLITTVNNSWSYKNIYVATGSENQVYGILSAYSEGEVNTTTDFKVYFKNLSFFDALKFLMLDIGDIRAGADLNNGDFYLSDLAVDLKCRGRGIGTFILKNSIDLAKEKRCKRVVLDVDMENEGALRLYKRLGFEIFNRKSFKWFGGEKGVYNMEYKLI
jgi:ribosomal protein S18 acetylase RimI-like enzyme